MAIVLDQIQGLFSAIGHQGIIAQLGQHGLAHITDHFFVIDQKDCFGSPDQFTFDGNLREGVFIAQRQMKIKGGTDADFTIYHGKTVVIVNDAVNRSQAQAGPAPLLFGGEKGVEYPLPGGLVHADTGVRHRQLDIPPGCDVVRLAVRLVQVDNLGRQVQLAAIDHGLPGIDVQIQQYLFDLTTVHSHYGGWVLEPGMYPDFFLCPPEHFGAFAHQVIDLGRLDFIFATLGQPQELAGQISGIANIGLDRLDIFQIHLGRFEIYRQK